MQVVWRWVSSLTNVDSFRALHKNFFFRRLCSASLGTHFSHRSEIFNHSGDASRIQIGRHVLIDGTLEVYERGILTIGDYTFVGRSRIFCTGELTIGQHCLISDNVSIMDSDLHPVSAARRVQLDLGWSLGQFPNVYNGVLAGPVTLEDKCWIGFGSAILKGVRIGEGSIIGANSVITKDVPPWTIVAGNPAKIIREIPVSER